MNLEKLIAVGGTNAGVYKVINSRNDGLIVEALHDPKRFFIPSRGNQFTPMQSISVYDNEGGTQPLTEVFGAMKSGLETLPLPNPKDKDNVLRDYFSAVMPSHDRERVYISDIRKIIKWFAAANGAGLLEETAETAETTAAETEDNA